jgi:hypothetical protein
MIGTSNTVDILAIDGEEPASIAERESWVIHNDPHWSGQVVIDIGGKSYTVSKADLDAALQNSVNIARY